MFNKLFVSRKEYDKQIDKLHKEINNLYEELNKINKKLDYIEPNWYRYKTLEYDYNRTESFIPEPCKTCSNHPSNGGSGICHCILGTPNKITV